MRWFKACCTRSLSIRLRLLSGPGATADVGVSRRSVPNGVTVLQPLIGLVPVVVDESTHRWLLEHPGVEVTVDLEATTLTLPTGVAVKFPLESFARYGLLNGIDELGYLLSRLRLAARSRQAASGLGPSSPKRGFRPGLLHRVQRLHQIIRRQLAQ